MQVNVFGYEDKVYPLYISRKYWGFIFAWDLGVIGILNFWILNLDFKGKREWVKYC